MILKNLKQEQGVTLLEVMVSILLISLLIMAFSGSFVTGLRSETETEKRLAAINLTESIIDALESYSDEMKNLNDEYKEEDEFDSFSDNLNDYLNKTVKNNFIDNVSDFRKCIINISLNDNFDEDDKYKLFDVEIKVQWGENSNYTAVSGIKGEEENNS